MTDDEFLFASDWAVRLRNFSWKPWHAHRVLSHRAEPIGDRIERLREAHTRTRLGDPSFAGDIVSSVVLEIVERVRPDLDLRIIEALTDLVSGLACQNRITFAFPDIENRSWTADEAAEITDLLDEIETRIRYEERIRDYFLTGIAMLLGSYLGGLPLVDDRSSPFRIPLYTSADPAHLVGKTVATVTIDLMPEADSIRALAFFETRQQLISNVLSVSNLTYDKMKDAPHKVLWPRDSGLETDAMVRAYLQGTPFLPFLETSVSLAIPRDLWREHCFVAAPTGHGKTQLLQALIYDFLADTKTCPGMFVLDSQGPMLKKLQRLTDCEMFSPETVRLNLFKLGPLDSNTADLFLYLFSAIDAELTGKQAGAFQFLLRLMYVVPDPTLHTLLEIVDTPRGRYDEHIRKLDSLAQSFFDRQFYGTDMKATRTQLARRLYQLLSDPLFSQIFGGTGPQRTFDAASLMQSGKVILLDTSETKLGVMSSAVLGRFYIAQILAAAYRRGERPNLQHLLIVDECAPYLDNRTEMLLSKARKFGLGSIWATQYLEQIPSSVKAAIYGNTAIKMAGPVSYSDAHALGREMMSSGDFLRSMRRSATDAEFACYVRNLTPTPVRVTVPFFRFEDAIAGLPPPPDDDELPEHPDPMGPGASPRAHERQLNEFSLRDTTLPLPETQPVPPEQSHSPSSDEPRHASHAPSSDDPAEPSEW